MVTVFGLLATSCDGTGPGADTSSPASSPVVITPMPTAPVPGTPRPQSQATEPSVAIEELLADLQGLPFDVFLENSYARLLLRDPEFLTRLGISDRYGLRDDQLNDLSDVFMLGTRQLEAGTLALLRAFDRHSLSPDDGVSYDIYEWYLAYRVDGHRFWHHDYPVHHLGASYNGSLILFLTEEHPMASPENAEDFITRVSQIDRQVDQILEGLEVRRDLGLVPPDFILSLTIGRLKADLRTNAPTPETVEVDRLALFTTFRERLGGIEDLGDADRQILVDAARVTIERSFVPAWIALIEHLETLQPSAGSDPGVWRFPDGDAFYAYLLHGHTSTDLTAEEIHQLGLAAVKRTTTEMRAAFDALGYPTDAALGELRSRAAREGGFVGGSSDAARQGAVDEMRSLVDEAGAASAVYFEVLPQAEVFVIADDIGDVFYVPGSVDGARAGLFHAEVSRTPRYIIPTVTYHNTIPGHHLQVALAQELDLPFLRRFIRFNAFFAGWALYAERLAWEMGLYTDDPLGNIGRLELELVRAVGLVVDTGLHALGWTREDATEYIEETIGDSFWSHDVARYTVLPGQATGSLIGFNRILDLRAESAKAYGENFDIAAFHDVVLGSGSVPLAILEQLLAAYLAAAPPPTTTTAP